MNNFMVSKIYYKRFRFFEREMRINGLELIFERTTKLMSWRFRRSGINWLVILVLGYEKMAILFAKELFILTKSSRRNYRWRIRLTKLCLHILKPSMFSFYSYISSWQEFCSGDISSWLTLNILDRWSRFIFVLGNKWFLLQNFLVRTIQLNYSNNYINWSKELKGD